MLDYIRY